MLRSLVATENRFAPTLARLALGLVMFPHGMQKLLGWFGGFGFEGQMRIFTTYLHIPPAFAVLAIVAESIGSIGLLTGFLGRVAAFGIACDMCVAAYMVHVPNGFFMNWSGKQQGEGFEFHILAFALAVIVLIWGSGAWSIDRAITERQERLSMEHARA